MWVISKLLIKVNKYTYPIITNIVCWMWKEETVQTEQIRDLDNTAGQISNTREVIFRNLYEIHYVAHIHTIKGNLICFFLFSFKQSRLIPHTQAATTIVSLWATVANTQTWYCCCIVVCLLLSYWRAIVSWHVKFIATKPNQPNIGTYSFYLVLKYETSFKRHFLKSNLIMFCFYDTIFSWCFFFVSLFFEANEVWFQFCIYIFLRIFQ